MAYGSQPRIRKRILGRMLKLAREEAGLTAREVEEKLDIAKPTLYRYESGHTSARKALIKPLCELYGINDPLRIARMEEWAVRAKEHTPLGVASSVGPTYTDFADAEWMATRLNIWELGVIPGLLQTKRTSEEAIRSGMLAQPGQPLISAELLAAHLKLREGRKELLNAKTPPQLWVVIGEAAIRTPPTEGDVEGHREQIQHLLNLGETRASIQVLPLSSGTHAGLSGGFIVMAIQEVELVFREGYVGDGIFVEDEDQVGLYRARYERLMSQALSVPDTRRFLHDFLGTL